MVHAHPLACAANCAPAMMSTCSTGSSMPFSAMKIRTRRGLGAGAQS
jgi:hypothetical protein